MTGPANPMAPVMGLRKLAMSAAYAGALRAAVRLRLPDALGPEPATSDSLAAEVNADPEALGRLLRALSAHGVFTEVTPGSFAHTELSSLLREDAENSLRFMVLWATEPWTWQVWGHLDTAVRTGKGVFGDLFGKEFFTYLHEDAPESADVFNRAMTQASALSSKAVARVLDLSGVRRVADIAGGEGHLLATVLDRNPGLHGTLLDLPSVVANANPRLRAGGDLAERTALVPGDCRVAVPVQADYYILKNILEWDDDSTVGTLRNIVATAPAGARVVVVENVLDDSPEMQFTTAMDLLLLLNVNGRKHTRQGLVDLIGRSGLRLQEVRPSGPYLHVFESTVPD
jgi:C-methyltransferase